MGLGAERANQPEAARGIGKDADDPRASLDLLVEPFEHVGRLQVLVVLAGQAVEVQRLPDLRLDPVGELRVAALPPLEPRLEVLLGFFEIAPVIEPAELLAAIVVGLPRQVVEGVAEEMHVAALPHRLGQQLPDGALQSGASNLPQN